MTTPLVSVVLGVRDGGATLAATLDSVLNQEGVEMELVVVDDGSSDDTREVALRAAEADRRVSVLGQPPSGLTAALIRGCAAARGAYIARQDAGDRSLPGRLAALATLLDREPSVVLVSGGTRFLGPRGEPLHEIVQTPAEADAGLRADRPERLRGPSIHGCVMFRRADYVAVNGYRAEFRVAQDLDLWLRLAERGSISAVPRVLYEATFGLGSISALQRRRQVAAAEIAFSAAVRRRRGESDARELERARALSSRPSVPGRRDAARAAYFVGSRLIASDPDSARYYFGRALAANPLHLKALVRWLSTR